MQREARQALRQHFDFRCGYCGVHENELGAELTVDHFQPRSRGGTDASDNLVYSCHACNEFKGDHWEDAGPQRILHPLRDTLSAHLELTEDGEFRALTETGSFHLAHLRLNRPPLVARRRRQLLLQRVRALHQDLLRDLQQVERQAENLAALLEDLNPQSGHGSS